MSVEDFDAEEKKCGYVREERVVDANETTSQGCCNSGYFGQENSKEEDPTRPLKIVYEECDQKFEC